VTQEVSIEVVSLRMYYDTLKGLHRFYREQCLSVGPRTQSETIQCLLDMRAMVKYLIEHAPSTAIKFNLHKVQDQRQSVLVSIQAFSLEYGSLSSETILTRKNWIYKKIERLLQEIEAVFEKGLSTS
jgi:hypothetical protein